MPTLSIIVPVYNKVKYIDECLQSILAQTFTDFELILVNDGSTDGSGIKCEQYQKQDSRIRVIDQKNLGVSAARNAGMKTAIGKYLGFIDSDDSIKSDMYELLISNILTLDADISVCRLQVIGPGKSAPPEKEGAIVLSREQAIVANLRGELDMNLNNKIYKKEVCVGIEFEGIIYEDILFTAKIFLNSRRTVIEHLIKYNYIIRDNSVSMDSFNINYMQTIDVSSKILALVTDERPEINEEAKAFDFQTNLSLLNLLLLQNPTKYSSYLKRVRSTLSGYNSFLKTNSRVSKKHIYAYRIYRLSPGLYKSLMYLYCIVTQSDVIKRTI